VELEREREVAAEPRRTRSYSTGRIRSSDVAQRTNATPTPTMITSAPTASTIGITASTAFRTCSSIGYSASSARRRSTTSSGRWSTMKWPTPGTSSTRIRGALRS
jgi:hypothetical protein